LKNIKAVPNSGSWSNLLFMVIDCDFKKTKNLFENSIGNYRNDFFHILVGTNISIAKHILID